MRTVASYSVVMDDGKKKEQVKLEFQSQSLKTVQSLISEGSQIMRKGQDIHLVGKEHNRKFTMMRMAVGKKTGWVPPGLVKWLSIDL